LIYLVYIDLDWPTQKVFERTAISPDNIFEKIFTYPGMEVIALYRDGIETNPHG
jgi:hypothetical protein